MKPSSSPSNPNPVVTPFFQSLRLRVSSKLLKILFGLLSRNSGLPASFGTAGSIDQQPNLDLPQDVADDPMRGQIAALTACGKLVEAERAATQAVNDHPENADALVALGEVLVHTGRRRQAMDSFKKALAIQPEHLDALLNQAMLRDAPNGLRGFVDHIRRKLRNEGNSLDLRVLLAKALRHNGQLEEAEAVCKEMLQRDPTYAPGWKALSECASASGDPAKRIEYGKKALALGLQENPEAVFSAVVFCSTYLSDESPQSIFELHREWAARYETPMRAAQFQHPRGTDPEKRLKIGYMSGDLRSHPVGLLLRSVLQWHRHDNFEIHCFSTSSEEDYLTRILKVHADWWHSVQLLSTKELAEFIHALNIDILVDLSGHTVFNRLPVFACKPAPVQASWIGYFHSTGLSSIDYFITDPYTTPREGGQLFSEVAVPLPHSRFCYTPFEFAPEVAPVPFEMAGYVTFGSFNRLGKLSDSVIDAWARIVTKVPGSKLLIKCGEIGNAGVAARTLNRFEASGLSRDRVILRSSSDYARTFEEYGEVDIALDPFPFNGGMTTLDALWMGVPVIALAGGSVVSRQSLAILANLQLDDLVFESVESYIDGAVKLALDSDRMRHLRTVIRPRMSRSPICDAEQFSQDLETLYRRMWRGWCEGEKLGNEVVAGAPVARKILSRIAYTQAPDDFLQGLFQHKRWQPRSPMANFLPLPDTETSAGEKIEFVCATRLSQEEFWKKSALGISLQRLQRDDRMVVHIAYENKLGLPEVYNARIDASDSQDVLVFIHDDVWIDDLFIADRVIEGLSRYEVIGVAGNRRRIKGQPAWGFLNNAFVPDRASNLSGRMGHDSHPFGTLAVFGPAPAECELLDGVFLAARKPTLKRAKVKFDPRFDFHFYDLDFCRSARTNHLRIGTWPISLTHQSHGAYGTQRWTEQYRRYLEKWGD